jgi:hypothetical protein
MAEPGSLRRDALGTPGVVFLVLAAVAIALLPWLPAVAVAAGLGLAAWLRRRRPDVYAGLEALGVDAEPVPR